MQERSSSIVQESDGRAISNSQANDGNERNLSLNRQSTSETEKSNDEGESPEGNRSASKIGDLSLFFLQKVKLIC